jgi:hypothetical protein
VKIGLKCQCAEFELERPNFFAYCFSSGEENAIADDSLKVPIIKEANEPPVTCEEQLFTM